MGTEPAAGGGDVTACGTRTPWLGAAVWRKESLDTVMARGRRTPQVQNPRLGLGTWTVC